jgi:SAM-dependent methyltransferase
VTDNKLVYEGRDLEAMDFAVKYHTWVLNLFKPYLGKTILEVGAGSGSFTDLMIQVSPKKIIAIEPSDEMYPLLQKTAKAHKNLIETHKKYFSDIRQELKKKKVDSAVYINVFEHIEDDEQELRYLYETLPHGAHVCIFVPAGKHLMSDFDRSIGHYRRYTKKELVDKAEAAGFTITLARRFDFAGVVPWYLKFTLMKSTKMEPGLAKVYDNIVVPIVSRIEKINEPLFGKNVILVAEKK